MLLSEVDNEANGPSHPVNAVVSWPVSFHCFDENVELLLFVLREGWRICSLVGSLWIEEFHIENLESQGKRGTTNPARR